MRSKGLLPKGGKRDRSGKDDPELVAGTEAHYEDPAYYQKNYERRFTDVRYYVARAIASGGPVLEYGCGNGRITLPIARAGIEIVGVDLSRPMLADLSERLSHEGEDVRELAKVQHGDMRQARLRRRFPLVICPFNAFLHLYDRVSVERFLARVTEHLAPRGELVFDVSMPSPEELARTPDRAYRTPRFNYPGVGLVRYSERFDYEHLRQILFVQMEFMPENGSPKFSTPLAHRQFYPQELEALLHYNGFSIANLEGDFEGPAVEATETLVYTVKRARAGRKS